MFMRIVKCVLSLVVLAVVFVGGMVSTQLKPVVENAQYQKLQKLFRQCPLVKNVLVADDKKCCDGGCVCVKDGAPGTDCPCCKACPGVKVNEKNVEKAKDAK